MTAKEFEIRQAAAEYVLGSTTLRDFVLWLAPRTWSLHESDEFAAADLAARIGLRVAEYTSGAWREEQLRELVAEIAFPLSELRVISWASQEEAPHEAVRWRADSQARTESLAVSL